MFHRKFNLTACSASIALCLAVASLAHSAEPIWSDLTGVFRDDGGLLLALRSSSDTERVEGVLVPNLYRTSVADSRQLARLADLNFAAGTYYIAPDKWRDEVAVGTVGLQTPPAGVHVRPGATLAAWTFLKAGASQPTVKMPDLIGVELAVARKRLVDLKLPPLDASPAEGKVVAQYPPAGRTIYEGTSVHLVVGP